MNDNKCVINILTIINNPNSRTVSSYRRPLCSGTRLSDPVSHMVSLSASPQLFSEVIYRAWLPFLEICLQLSYCWSCWLYRPRMTCSGWGGRVDWLGLLLAGGSFWAHFWAATLWIYCTSSWQMGFHRLGGLWVGLFSLYLALLSLDL